MAIKIESASVIADKWREVTPGRQRYYQANTPGAASEWESNTKAAQATFTAAVTAGDIGRKFLGGVIRAGAAKFARKVTDVGVNRFGPGVQAAVQDMQAGFEPYQAVIAGLTLPRKGPRGDAGNLARVSTVSEALNRKRLALLGAGG